MRQKMNIRCPSTITNSRSCTQDLKINSAKQWVDILDGIDAIAHKVKEISAQDLEQCQHRNKGCSRDRCEFSKSTTRVNTTFDCSRSISRKKNNKYCKNTKVEKKPKLNCTHSTHSPNGRKMRGFCKCQNQYSKKLKVCYCCEPRIKINQVNPQKICKTKCHQVMLQMTELKKINDQLIRKNQQLQKKLQSDREQSKYSSKQKIQREKANQIILRVIHQKQKDNEYQTQKIPSCISVQLKPNQRFKSKNQREEDNAQSLKKFKKSLEKSQKIQVKIQRNPKNNERYDINRILDGQIDKYCPQKSRNESMMISHASNNLRKSRPSQLKSLETEFDRLMQISYLQRNKARKRVIWGEMKSIANQLKMMRNFTQS